MNEKIQADSTAPAAAERPVDLTKLPISVRDSITSRAGADAQLTAAKDGSSYKGSVVYADKDYLVQLTGSEQRYAIVHRRGDVELRGSSLADRDARGDLLGRNLQVHYRGGSAKAYPWDAEKERRARLLAEPQKLMAAARQYAADRIANPKLREAFMSHFSVLMQGVARGDVATDRSQAPASPAKDRTAPVRERSRSLER